MSTGSFSLGLYRWGKRVFLVSFSLLVVTCVLVFLNERDGWWTDVPVISEVPRLPAGGAAADSSDQVPVSLGDPLAVVVGEKTVIVDRKGRAVPLAENSGPCDLPVITGLEQMTEGRDELLADVLQTLDDLRHENYAMYGRISELHFEKGSGWTGYLTGDGLPVLLGDGDLASSLFTLGAALPELERFEHLEKLKFLDLRFENQIVVR